MFWRTLLFCCGGHSLSIQTRCGDIRRFISGGQWSFVTCPSRINSHILQATTQWEIAAQTSQLDTIQQVKEWHVTWYKIEFTTMSHQNYMILDIFSSHHFPWLYSMLESKYGIKMFLFNAIFLGPRCHIILSNFTFKPGWLWYGLLAVRIPFWPLLWSDNHVCPIFPHQSRASSLFCIESLFRYFAPEWVMKSDVLMAIWLFVLCLGDCSAMGATPSHFLLSLYFLQVKQICQWP